MRAKPHIMLGGVEHKHCSSCDEVKPLEAFNRNARERDGLQAYCRTCTNRGVKAASLKKLYGITIEDFDRMLMEQGGLCAACGEECVTGHALCVDHDHDTGAVRALLCRRCNSALGLTREDPAILRSLAEYVENHADIPRRIRS